MTLKRKRSASTTEPRKKPRGLSEVAKDQVKAIVQRKQNKSMLHNGPLLGALTLTGTVPSAPTIIQTLTEINAGNNELTRGGDQVYVDRIKMRLLLQATAINDAVRVTILRQPRSSMPVPTTISPVAVFQNAAGAGAGVVSAIQDDQPCQVLYDRVFTVGTAAGLQEIRYINIDLNYNKRPLPLEFLDGSAIGTSLNTVRGDIELCMCSVTGNTSYRYAYDLMFHDK